MLYLANSHPVLVEKGQGEQALTLGTIVGTAGTRTPANMNKANRTKDTRANKLIYMAVAAWDGLMPPRYEYNYLDTPI